MARADVVGVMGDKTFTWGDCFVFVLLGMTVAMYFIAECLDAALSF